MRTRRRILLAVAVGVAACSGARASDGGDGTAPAAGLPVVTGVAAPDRQAAVDSATTLLREALGHGGVGASVAVVGPEGPVWTAGVGYADRATGEPVRPGRTLFRIYSVSKTMTATAAARLMERGRLDPSADVRRWVPDFLPGEEPITVLQLATHRSGIRHYSDDAEARGDRRCETVDEAVAIFSDDPLLHPPGDGETYSSWGYVLLSAVLEGATGTDYGSLMEALVFEPAGVEGVALADPPDPPPGRTGLYREDGRGPRPEEPADITCKWGAGAWLATAPAVARFGMAMVDGTLLSPRSLGLFLRGETVLTSQGIGAGGMAFLVVDTERDVSVALLSNTVGPNVGPRLQAAARETARLFGGFGS